MWIWVFFFLFFTIMSIFAVSVLRLKFEMLNVLGGLNFYHCKMFLSNSGSAFY